MTITFARLQDYLDSIVRKAQGNLSAAPHKRFWTTHDGLTKQPLPRVKCQNQPIFAVKFLDQKMAQVDADNSPLYVILTNSDGFCGKGQMPPGGPFITDANYSLTLTDGTTVVAGDQVKQDIHGWLAAGALDDPPPSA
jgi:hypothetical protein